MKSFKYYILVILVLLSGKNFSFAEEWRGIPLPEETSYKITYFKIVAGYGSIKIEKVKFNEKEAIKVTGRIWSSKFFSSFYKVNDTILTIMDAKTLEPLFHFVDYNEGKTYRRKVDYHFDYEKKLCTSKEGELDIHQGLLDPLSALMYLRLNALTKEKPEIKKVFDGRDIKEVKAVLKKIKNLKTRFGRKKVMVIKPILKGFRKEGITKVQEKVTLYLDEELPRIPYLVKGKLLIGSLKANLIEIRN